MADAATGVRLEGVRRELKGLVRNVHGLDGIERTVALSLATQAAMVETLRVTSELLSALLWGLRRKGVLTTTELEAARAEMLAAFDAAGRPRPPGDEFAATLGELRKATRRRRSARRR